MRQTLVPVLLITMVALSSSNVLPLLLYNQLELDSKGLDGQHNDNIFRTPNSQILKDIFCRDATTSQARLPKLCKSLNLDYIDSVSNGAEKEVIAKKDENYNGDGFRKEQWHNYPKQMDRLHTFLYDSQDTDIKPFDPDPHSDVYNDDLTPDPLDKGVYDVRTNEFLLDSNGNSVYDSLLAATNPLLILKIRLSYLGDNNDSMDSKNYGVTSQNAPEAITDELFANKNPEVKIMKVKREDTSKPDFSNTEEQKPTRVQKRIFSLWSRLQSLSHKGHELHHRRHLHAYYSLPEASADGSLTAETRAFLGRPPGSPLRWG